MMDNFHMPKAMPCHVMRELTVCILSHYSTTYSGQSFFVAVVQPCNFDGACRALMRLNRGSIYLHYSALWERVQLWCSFFLVVL